jgi:hypothetical protein
LAAAYGGLAHLSQAALIAAREGRQEQFLKVLDILDQQLLGDSLEGMLDGTADNVPEWLRKDRK